MTDWWTVYWLTWAVVFGGVTAVLALCIVAFLFGALVTAVQRRLP
jgi:hypothetical protein